MEKRAKAISRMYKLETMAAEAAVKTDALHSALRNQVLSLRLDAGNSGDKEDALRGARERAATKAMEVAAELVALYEPVLGRNAMPNGHGSLDSETSAAPAFKMHKATSPYQVGAMRTDDPKEETKQRKFKALLNKLTLDNFDRILGQIVKIEMNKFKTMASFVDQIFNRALLETMYSELYSELCQRLQTACPKFEDPANNIKADFRKLMVNKCQMEFQEGAKARCMAEEGAEKDALEAAAAASMAAVKLQDGKVPPDNHDSLAVQQARAQRDAAELRARCRALGNMQFIGFLYRQGLMTEKIVHFCLGDLLEKPSAEELECAAELLFTVGGHLAVGKDPSKLEAYIKRLDAFSKDKDTYNSRVRFMLMDIIDLSQHGW